MNLATFWFILVAILFTGYFVLEGFDFGVGILLSLLGRDETDRRVMINTIGPVWDGNEVWLLTAGGATFAAFPEWYAAMFSAFYLPLLIILVALIFRGVAFEFRGKHDSPKWRQWWDAAIFGGSLVPAILWGVAFGNVLHGIKLNAAHAYVGNVFDLLNPYALLGGLATLTLFLLNGAVFLALKTDGDVRIGAHHIARWTGLLAVLAGGGFLAWTEASHRFSAGTGTGAASIALAALAGVALVVAVLANLARREGVAFAATACGIACTTATLFTALYHNVLPSSLAASYSLTTANAASTAKTLMLMTVVACIFLPFVLLYQGWTYWVFRKRIGGRPQENGGAPASGSTPASGGARP